MTTKQLTLDDIRHTIDNTAATLMTSRPLDIVPMPSGKCLILVTVAGHPKLVHLQSLVSGLYGEGVYSSAYLHRCVGRATVYIRHQDNVTPAHVDNFGSQRIRRKGAAQCVPYQTAIDVLTASSTDPLACMRESGQSRSLDRRKEDKTYLAEVVAWLQQQLQPQPAETETIDTKPASDTAYRAYTTEEVEQKVDELHAIKTKKAMQAGRVRVAQADAEAAAQKLKSEIDLQAKIDRQYQSLLDDLRRGHDA